MMAIFGGSTDLLASSHTSRFLVPFLRWLKPDISPAAIEAWQYFIRKCGHATEYAILALLVLRALRSRPESRAGKSGWEAFRLAFLVAVFYAATDEFHQTFVSTRQGLVSDVMVDATGAALGLFIVWLIGRWRQRK